MAGFCTFWEKDLYTSNPDLWKLQPPFPLLPYLTQLGTVGVLSAGRYTFTTMGPICSPRSVTLVGRPGQLPRLVVPVGRLGRSPRLVALVGRPSRSPRSDTPV